MTELTGSREKTVATGLVLGNLATSSSIVRRLERLRRGLMVGMLGMLDMRLLCPVRGSGLSSRPQFVT